MVWRVPKSEDALQVRFWGVRGSNCASGPEFVEFGGHTPCVEVRCGDRLFVVDAGTGIAALGAALGSDAPEEVDILLSHLHLDHIGGLPFFKPCVLGRNRLIRTHCGNLEGQSAKDSLEKLFSPPIFPITLDYMPATFEHAGFVAGETLRFPDGAVVETIPLNHPGGATGFRFSHGGRVFCYLSDMEHSDPWPDPRLVRFVRDADLVVYDAMFSESEYTSCKGWGHSTWEKGVELCQAAGVKALAVFHLYPGHTDAMLRATELDLKKAMPTAFIARERQAFSFPALAPERRAPVPAE